MTARLIVLAKRFFSQGANIVPLSSKKPIRNFDLEGAFRGRRPDAELIEEYLALAVGYGICAGAISRGLAILDFDSLDECRAFLWELPFTRETLIVQSQRGYHLHFRLPERFWALAKGKMRGGDFIFNGAYAVGPGSVVDGYTYKIVSEAQEALVLSEDETQAMLNWLGLSQDSAEEILNNDQLSLLSWSVSDLSETSILSEYSRLAAKKGRNNALFTLACQLRTRGVEIGDSRLNSLVLEHVRTVAPRGHRFETEETREKEAWRTVRSAFVYRRSAAPRNVFAWTSLPNGLREALLNYRWKGVKSALLARLLDALFLAGVREDEELSYSQIAKIAATARISSRSLSEILLGKFSVIGDQWIWHGTHTESNLGQSKSNITPMPGERDNWKVEQYRMPFLRDLARLLQVRLGTLADPITVADLQSSKIYRQALHRLFIGRLNPQVGLRFMAGRLGLRQRSVRRYNAEMEVTRVVRELETVLSFQNVKFSLSKVSGYRNLEKRRITPGYYLEVGEDKERFPAILGVALKHLKLGKMVKLVQELTSQYFLPEKDFGVERRQRLSRLDFVSSGVGDRSQLEPVVKSVSPTMEHSAELERGASLLLEGSGISGIAGWRLGVLRRAGIETVRQLYYSDAETLAALPLGRYVKSRMVTFWQAQARALLQGVVLEGWSYSDWKLYQEELALLSRVERIEDLRRRGQRKRYLVSLFVERGWIRYGDQHWPLWLQKGLRRSLRSAKAGVK